MIRDGYVRYEMSDIGEGTFRRSEVYMYIYNDIDAGRMRGEVERYIYVYEQ
jgi:hypothetical protein